MLYIIIITLIISLLIIIYLYRKTKRDLKNWKCPPCDCNDVVSYYQNLVNQLRSEKENLLKKCDCGPIISAYETKIKELNEKLETKVTGTQKLKEFAERMRNNPTFYEKKFYDYLVQHRVNFEFQKILYCTKSYIVDFFLIDYKVVVEIDGEYHFTEDQKEKDWQRSLDIYKTYGYKVLRISNKQIEYNHFEEELITFLKSNK